MFNTDVRYIFIFNKISNTYKSQINSISLVILDTQQKADVW